MKRFSILTMTGVTLIGLTGCLQARDLLALIPAGAGQFGTGSTACASAVASSAAVASAVAALPAPLRPLPGASLTQAQSDMLAQALCALSAPPSTSGAKPATLFPVFQRPRDR